MAAVDNRGTLRRGRELLAGIGSIVGAAGGPREADAEIVEYVWRAWSVVRARVARLHLLRLIVLEKRARSDRKAAAQLERGLGAGELRARLPGLAPGPRAEARVRREVERIARLEPSGRGRPRKGTPKPRFYSEILRALPALGVDRVNERQLIRDYRAALAELGPAPRTRRRR